MREITVKIYKFNELDAKVQEKVINEMTRFIQEMDAPTFLDDITDAWREKLTELGYENPEILYSGFGSQGDGASFTSDNIKEASGIKELIDQLSEEERAEISIRLRRIDSRYYHENTVTVDAEGLDSALMAQKLEIDAHEVIKKLSREIYKELETAYDGLSSRENVIDFIDENDYEFFADGRTYSE